MTDAETIQKILLGDQQELSFFYKKWAPKLTSVIVRKITDPKDAEEVLQDTLFAFLEAIRDFHGKSTISTFLYAICYHKIADYHRKKRLKQIVFSRFPQLEFLVSPLLSPEEQLDTELMKQKIHTTLSQLLPHYRQILVKKYLDKLSIAQIAMELQVSVKSVEAKLFRARKAFVDAFISI